MLPSLFGGFIAGLIAVNLFSSLASFQALRSRAKSQEYSYHDRDYPEQWVLSRPAPPVAMIAEESVHYAIDTPEAMEEWATTQVDGGGFMRVGPPQRGFAVAMFHQMHCMRLMRWALGGKYDVYAWGHMQHCLNYLRQDILCAADVTLEPADILERDYENQRFGSIHVCNNWEVLYKEGNDNWQEWYQKQKSNSTSA